MENVLSLTDERLRLIEKMHELIDSWDGTAAEGPKIIAMMKELLEELQEIQTRFVEPTPYSKEEATHLTEIYKKEKLIFYAMKREKELLTKEMMGMNKKETLIQSYLYPRKTPTFVNQDL